MKTVNSIAFSSPQFAVLSDTQLQDIHLAALEVLRRVGIRFHHQEAVEMLKEAGAFISDGDLVKFPARMVEDAVASTPGRIILCDRDGEPAVFLEGTKVYFGTGSDCLNLLDPETGEHRKFTQADLINSYHLCDALPNIHFVMSNGIPSDVDPDLLYDVQMALMLEHTTKPIVFVTNDRASCQRAIDMAAAVAGGHEALVEQQHILLTPNPVRRCNSQRRRWTSCCSWPSTSCRWSTHQVHSWAALHRSRWPAGWPCHWQRSSAVWSCTS
jgi:trimethylamine--corrinoid protein Co-methyltransferase